jgi:hypothetical protein
MAQYDWTGPLLRPTRIIYSITWFRRSAARKASEDRIHKLLELLSRA